MVGVPATLLMRLNQLVLRFVEGRTFCSGMPDVLPVKNVSRFLETLVDMLADEVIARGKGRRS
jgi:hypothetical protein